MKRILIVEDDSIITDVYSQKLRAEGFEVDVAVDGRTALKIFHDRRVDLVLLDLLLPEVSGVELLQRIRSEFGPSELPVLVFTNAYLGGIVQQAWEAGANQVIPKAGIKCSLVVAMIKNALANPPPSAVPLARTTTRQEFDPAVRKHLLESSSKMLAALWRPLKRLAGQGHRRGDSQACFRELFRVVRPLTAKAAIAGLDRITQMSSALEALLKELCDKPDRLSPSVLLTIAQAIDTLKFLFAQPVGVPANNLPAAQILVVDDDEFVRQSVSQSLARVNLKAICVDNPVNALKRRTGERFDLIILDIEMPEASGFELCTRFRAMPGCRDTPIIFLSVHRDHKNRIESALRGGSDYVTKPFLYTELAAKALSFVIRGPVKSGHATKGRTGNGTDSVFSRRDLNILKQGILGGYGA
jgi:DNA-binding response OmpR family regulator